jgi:hypothetical protein
MPPPGDIDMPGTPDIPGAPTTELSALSRVDPQAAATKLSPIVALITNGRLM